MHDDFTNDGGIVNQMQQHILAHYICIVAVTDQLINPHIID